VVKRVGMLAAMAVLVAWGDPAVAAPAPAASSAASPAASAPAGDTEAEMTVAELDRMLAPLTDPDLAKRAAAAKALTELGSDATRAIEKKLLEFRRSTLEMQPVVKAVRDTNPGKLGENWDLAEALLKLKAEGPAFRLTIGTVMLVRALAHIATMPAVRLMVPVALDHGKVLFVDVQLQLRALGDKSVAALIESRKDPSGEVRHFSTTQLEAMQKRLPGEAVQTKSNQVLADVLRAYGDVRDMDAMSVILSFVSSDRAQVRAAARDALASFGQDAIWKLREAYSNLVGKPAPETWTADQVAKELFAAYDRFRLQEVYTLLEDGLKRYAEGKLEDATASFDKVLARQPLLDRRAEMVPAYVGLAQELEDKDRVRALALFRKALRLDPEGPRMGQIQSEIAYLEGMDLLGRGIADADTFRRALALDGGNAKARAELDRLEAASEVRQEKTRRWAAGGAVLALAIACIVLFGGGGKKKKPAAKTARA
jgi:tetratricopeptide (TPR) repeat protein